MKKTNMKRQNGKKICKIEIIHRKKKNGNMKRQKDEMEKKM